MKTKNVDSLLNSMLQALEKECRKNDLAPAFHRQYTMHREHLRHLVEEVVENDKLFQGK